MNLRLLKLIFRKKDQMPVYLIHSITERCNARCTHCFVYKDGQKPELTIDEIRELCKSLGDNLYHVALSGGEPFLRRDLAEIAQAYYENTNAQVIRISTNGFYVDRIEETTKRILELPSRRNLVVEFSCDGLREDHDRIRKLPGMFDRMVESYRRLAELEGRYEGFYVNINITVCKSNQYKLDELYDFLRNELGIRNTSLTLTRGQSDDLSELDVDIDVYERFTRRIEGELDRQELPGYAGLLNGLLVNAQNILARRRIVKTVRTNRFISRCYAGNLAGVLLSDGTIRPCELRPEVFGNIRQQGFQDLWRSPAAADFKKTCSRCFCTHECFLASNIVFNKRYSLQMGGLAASMFLVKRFRGLAARLRQAV